MPDIPSILILYSIGIIRVGVAEGIDIGLLKLGKISSLVNSLINCACEILTGNFTSLFWISLYKVVKLFIFSTLKSLKL